MLLKSFLNSWLPVINKILSAPMRTFSPQRNTVAIKFFNRCCFLPILCVLSLIYISVALFSPLIYPSAINCCYTMVSPHLQVILPINKTYILDVNYSHFVWFASFPCVKRYLRPRMPPFSADDESLTEVITMQIVLCHHFYILQYSIWFLRWQHKSSPFFLSPPCKVDLNRLYDDVKRYSCTPRNYSVNLREELRITSAVFFPRCLLVKRCGGNCGCGTDNWNSGCTCQAAKTTQKLHEVGLRSRIKDCPVHSGCSVSFYLNRCPAPFSATRLIEECLTNKLCHSYKTPTDLLSQESSQSL